MKRAPFSRILCVIRHEHGDIIRTPMTQKNAYIFIEDMVEYAGVLKLASITIEELPATSEPTSRGSRGH